MRVVALLSSGRKTTLRVTSPRYPPHPAGEKADRRRTWSRGRTCDPLVVEVASSSLPIVMSSLQRHSSESSSLELSSRLRQSYMMGAVSMFKLYSSPMNLGKGQASSSPRRSKLGYAHGPPLPRSTGTTNNRLHNTATVLPLRV